MSDTEIDVDLSSKKARAKELVEQFCAVVKENDTDEVAFNGALGFLTLIFARTKAHRGAAFAERLGMRLCDHIAQIVKES